MTTPATQDLEIYQGDSYDLFVRLKTRNAAGDMDYTDLTGCTGKAQIRQDASASQVLAEFTCSLADQITSKGGMLISLDPTQTAGLTVTAAKWDLQITFADGTVRTILAGNVTVTKEITRA